MFGKGRFVNSGTLHGFLTLYCLAGLRRFRRGTLRHRTETAAMRQWLALVGDTVHHDYDLAVQVVNCRRFVKGYSDTLQRGNSKYKRLSRSEEHTSELQSLMRISYAVFCLKKKKT